jgi:hypothetical protein
MVPIMPAGMPIIAGPIIISAVIWGTVVINRRRGRRWRWRIIPIGRIDRSRGRDRDISRRRDIPGISIGIGYPAGHDHCPSADQGTGYHGIHGFRRGNRHQGHKQTKGTEYDNHLFHGNYLLFNFFDGSKKKRLNLVGSPSKGPVLHPPSLPTLDS